MSHDCELDRELVEGSGGCTCGWDCAGVGLPWFRLHAPENPDHTAVPVALAVSMET